MPDTPSVPPPPRKASRAPSRASSRTSSATASPLPPPPPLSVAVIGCGPVGTSLLERLCANASDLVPGRQLHVHVVDPFPPGGGRVWRREQSRLLWANSHASHITVFTDASMTCEGPIRPGPSVWEWGRDRAAELRAGRLAPDLAPFADELARIDPLWFPSRRLLSAYLAWAFRHIVATAPPNVRVAVHRDRAVDITDAADLGDGTRQRIELAGGARITVDAVVLTQGHGDADPTPEERRLTAYARASGLVHLPRGYAADQDLAALRPGEPVIVRGIGLAFVDLMVRLTGERGGRFTRGADGTLAYRASGREPVLLAASRRGVPYRAKIGYQLTGELPPVPHFLTADAVADRPDPVALEFRRDVRPLLHHDMTWAYYHRLCTAHPERTALSWDTFAAHYTAIVEAADETRRNTGPATTATGSPGSSPAGSSDGSSAASPTVSPTVSPAVSRAASPAAEELAALVARAVPDPADRLDLALLDRPLAGRRFADADAVQAAMHTHIAGDLARRADPRFSADLAASHALQAGYAVLTRLLAAGRVSERSRLDEIPEFHGFFSYLTSGPPSPRLEELLALARAGVVRFLGEDVSVAAIDGGFTAHSPSVPGSVRTRALVEARLPEPSPASTRDPLLRVLFARGDLAEERLAGRPSGRVRTVPGELRLVAANGTPHPARFALGYGVAGGVLVTGFARPGIDAPVLGVGDALARTVLASLTEARPPAPAPPGPADPALAAAHP